MAELAGEIQRFQDINARLAVIGSGDPRHFKEFRKITGYIGPLFSDPSLKAFSFLNFTGGVAGFLSVKSIVKAVSAFKNGHRQGSVQGSAMQLGGAVVIDPTGSIQYYFASRKAGDHPGIDDLIRAVDH